MDAGPDAQHGVNTGVVESKYYVDVWLPDAKDYPGLRGASPKVQEALGLGLGLPDKPTVVPPGEIEINLKPRFYKRNEKNLDIDSESVAAISFSEDFAKQCNSNDVAVLAMMGGVLPAGKNFFRMGFSVETIAAIIGDQIINDNDGRVSHVFLIRVDNDLGNEFERAFSRAVNAPNLGRSLDILKIDENGTPITENGTPITKKIQITQTDEQVARNTSTNEGVISKWLTSCINNPKHPRNQGLRSVVIYGYWEQYWNFVIEVLRCKAFCNDEDWLYVESNYPLHYPFILYEARHVDDLDQDDLQNFTKERTDDIIPRSVEITSSGKNNKRIMGDKKQEKTGGESPEKPTESVFHPQKGNLRNNNEDERDFNIFNEKKMAHASTIAHAITNRDEPEEEHQKESKELGQEKLMPRELKRIRCITGRLVNDGESSFITFAKETVRLLRAAIRDAHEKKGKAQDRTIKSIRECICKFLANSKFYAAEHLGSFFFRKDGELFFPLYRYNGKLERQGIVRESCCNGVEFTKEAIADQLLQLSNSLNKITRAEIPRNLEVHNSVDAKKVFEEFSKMIAEISGAIEIKFVNYYPNTESQFYTWPDKGEENVGKTEQFVNVSIFDDVCKNTQGVIQINLKDFDLEDNDAYRVYLLVYERTGNDFDALTLAEWWNKDKGKDESSVNAVVFAKSRIRIKSDLANEDGTHCKYRIDNCDDYVQYDRWSKPHEFNEILRGLCQLLECRQDRKSDARFLYYIPEYIPEENKPEDNNSSRVGGQGGIVMTTRCKLSLFDLQIIENMVSRIFSKLKTCMAEHDVLLSNIKSAIGSIMSRNGSHNIGSHVLAALTHNIGTMPDDRVLYQYIQHRMDYIATATTDLPKWTQPTMFVGEIMRTFYMQRHLLEHIAESEKLHAFYFRGHDNAPKNSKSIRISLRRLKRGAFDGVLHDKKALIEHSFVAYDNKEANVNTPNDAEHNDRNGTGQIDNNIFNDDVRLAIPAGTIGNHAFYTIIENIIRNAAKHEKLDDDGNLEIVIGFINDEDKEYVEFFVWSKSKGNNLGEIQTRVNEIRAKINDSFIDNDGQLRREDWGLAEMKISAGILQRRSISEIGGLQSGDYDASKSSNWEIKEIISPIVVEEESQERQNQLFHFGYSFFIPKPKEMLFVFSTCCNIISPKIITSLKKRGIYIADGFARNENDKPYYDLVNVSENGEEIVRERKYAFDYSFVILPQDKIDSHIKEDSFPFRLMVWEPKSENQECPSIIWSGEAGNEHGMIPTIGETAILEALNLEALKNVSNSDALVENLVYSRWLEYLKAKTRGNDCVQNQLTVAVKVDENDSKSRSGRSLISDIDVWKFVFKHMYKNTLRSFCVQNPEIVPKIPLTLYALALWNPDIDNIEFKPWDSHSQENNIKEIESLFKQEIPENIKSKVRENITIKYLYKEFIKMKKTNIGNLSYVLGTLKLIDNNSEAVRMLSDFSEKIGLSTDIAKDMLKKKIADIAEDMLKKILTDLKEKYEDINIEDDLPFEINNDSNQFERFDIIEDYCDSYNETSGPIEILDLNSIEDASNVVNALSTSFLSAFYAADVMLRKYSEKIVTLPLIYSADDNSATSESENDSQIIGIDLRLESKTTELPIVYNRHGTQGPCSIYSEGLSGSQSSMAQMQSFVQKPDSGFLCRLVENALMRILIIDERFYRFLVKRKDIIKKMSWMNIWAVNTDVLFDTNVQLTYPINDASHDSTMPLEMQSDTLKKGTLPDNKFDIIIIHQGIIDKIYGTADSNVVSNFLERLKKCIPYVIVTTGRGIPANIPHSARVLPFSSIEQHLFHEYPEKVLLMNALMNLLPCGRSDNEE